MLKKLKTLPSSYKCFVKNKEDILIEKNRLFKIVKNFFIDFNAKKEFFSKKNPTKNLLYDFYFEYFEKIQYILYEFDRFNKYLTIYLFVGNDIELKKEIQKNIEELNSFLLKKIKRNNEIYNFLKIFVNYLLKEESILKKNEIKIIIDTLKDFERNGVALTENEREEVLKLNLYISNNYLKFEQNIQNSNNGIYVESKELEGISEEFILQLKKDNNNKFFLGTDYPTYFTVMKYSKDRDLRQRLYKEFNDRGFPNNVSVLDSLRKNREILAKKLGYKNYSEYDIENQMAKTIDTVEKFLEEVEKLTKKKALEEKEEIERFAKEEIFISEKDKNIHPWDVSYILNLYEKKYFKIDTKEISEYFPIQKTINKIIEIYSKFFDVIIEKIEYEEKYWLWTDPKDLVILRVTAKKDVYGINNFGDLILDLYPRDQKYTHACEEYLTQGIFNKDNKIIYYPISIIISNFERPSSERDGLLKHSDVTTLFHEFGHAFHSMFGVSKYISQAGTNTATDFVEVPSQLLEQWMWEESILKIVSSHYKNEKPLPDEIINSMIKNRSFGRAINLQRQIGLSRFSLNLFKDSKKDIKEVKKDSFKDLISFSYFDIDNNYECSFGHLSEYGSKYYSYLWSINYSLDLFSYIKENNGLLDKNIGKKLANNILSKGSSESYDSILKSFLDRDCNFNSFYKYINN
jgi:Zn-dependent oligopeptidase